MNGLFTYLFRHKEYCKIQNSYKDIANRYSMGLKVWQDNLPYLLDNSFSSKVFVVNNLEAIKEADNYAMEFLRISRNKEAVVRFIGNDKDIYSYSEIKRIVFGKEEVKKINEILSKAHILERKYPNAWSAFANGRDFSVIPTIELEFINDHNFYIKQRFLSIYNSKRIIVLSLLQGFDYNLNSFSNETINIEDKILSWFKSDISIPCTKKNFNIHLNKIDEHIAAILDSVYYGSFVTFSSSFTINFFYNYRIHFDSLNVHFDDAYDILKRNFDAVKAYNYINIGNSDIYIEDYYRIVDKDSNLFRFLELYKNERPIRNNARDIKYRYSLGFNSIFGDIDLDSCPLSTIYEIIDAEPIISFKNESLLEQQRLEQEQARLQQEQARLQQELEAKRKAEEIKNRIINQLTNCVSSWDTPSYSSIHCFSLYNYYPTTCSWEATNYEWEIRKTIWDFKANPTTPLTEDEIRIRHESAMTRIFPDILKLLHHTFSSNLLSKLTLVCIPSSKRIVTERRYKDFSEKLCKESGMMNGYNHISVIYDGDAKHLGGSNSAQYSINSSFFKDKYIILFDDVITSGRSMETFKYLLQNAGAIVICGISIGKTKHDRQFSNPIDEI